MNSSDWREPVCLRYGHHRIHHPRAGSLANHEFDRRGGWSVATVPTIEVSIGSEVQRTIDSILNDNLILSSYLHLVSEPMGRGNIRIGVLFLPILDDPLSFFIRSERNGGHYRSIDSEVE